MQVCIYSACQGMAISLNYEKSLCLENNAQKDKAKCQQLILKQKTMWVQCRVSYSTLFQILQRGIIIKRFKITGFKHTVKINLKCTAFESQCEQHETFQTNAQPNLIPTISRKLILFSSLLIGLIFKEVFLHAH